MDRIRLNQLIYEDKQVTDILLEDAITLIQKVKPTWERVIKQESGGPGPAYATQIVLPDGNIVLDVVVTTYTEFMLSEKHEPHLRQLVVAEGDHIRANYREDGTHPSQVKDLFIGAEKDYERTQLIKGPSSAQRTRAAIQKFLSS